MLFLFRSAPEVEKRIHSKLFRKFWRSRGTKEPAYITVFSFLYLYFLIFISYACQGCISCGTCSYLELTEDHVLTSAYVKIFRIVTRNAVNKSFWRKKDCSWPPLNKYAMNIWLSSLKIRAHLSWRTGKHLHVLHVLRTYSTCSCPGQQDTTTYAALMSRKSLCNDRTYDIFISYVLVYVVCLGDVGTDV